MRLRQFFVFFRNRSVISIPDLDSFQIRLPKFPFFIFFSKEGEDPALSGMAN